MKIDVHILDYLTSQAQQSPRLRMNYDLRTSSNDTSQRMLNALEPGTEVPIHRHTQSTETVVVVRGAVRQNFYDDNGRLTETFVVSAHSSCPIFDVPIGIWHNTESLESGTIIFEAKDGAYVPISKADILHR